MQIKFFILSKYKPDEFFKEINSYLLFQVLAPFQPWVHFPFSIQFVIQNKLCKLNIYKHMYQRHYQKHSKILDNIVILTFASVMITSNVLI